MDEIKTRQTIETDNVRIVAASGRGIASNRRREVPFDFIFVKDQVYNASGGIDDKWMRVGIAYHNPGTHLAMSVRDLSETQAHHIREAMKLRDEVRYGAHHEHKLCYPPPPLDEGEQDDE